MTDKKIIIDGIDVSKCIYFQQEDDEYTCGAEECNGSVVGCGACDNCYYKQLKRKEQECEQLRKTMHKDFCSHYVLGECSQKHHNNCVGRNQCIKDLEQECEALKAELEQYKKSKQASYEALQVRCNELELENRKFRELLITLDDEDFVYEISEIEFQRYLKFKRTFTEIKEIAESEIDSKEFMAIQCMLNGSVDNKNKVLKQILQKISEVIKDE